MLNKDLNNFITLTTLEGILADSRLTSTLKVVFLRLHTHLESKKKPGRPRKGSNPRALQGHSEISELGLFTCPQHLSRALRELQECGYLRVVSKYPKAYEISKVVK